MPSKKSSSSTGGNSRASGGGRTSNVEPRFQVFRDFAGCNFELAPVGFNLETGSDVEHSGKKQTDLQMNYVEVQNNVFIASNKTLQTRPHLVCLLSGPGDDPAVSHVFTDATLVVGKFLYVGMEDGRLFQYDIPKLFKGETDIDISPTIVNCVDKSGTDEKHIWESFEYVDDKLVGATRPYDDGQGGTLWTGAFDPETGVAQMENAKEVPDPEAPAIPTPSGSLKIAAEWSQDTPHRTSIAIAYINKYGPTKYSPLTTFYSNVPVTEWHAGQFAILQGEVPVGYDIIAVEIYYTVDNSQSLLLAGRTDLLTDHGVDIHWTFNWFGYLDTTSMWPVAQLQAPEQNYTKGAPVSYIKCIDSRVYMWGKDSERLYIGGNSGNLLSVSPGTGGGFVDVEPGTGQCIRVVTKYKTQSGNSIVTMLCDSPNSTKEQRFNLVENTLTISNEQNMKSWQAEQVAGAIGCKSPHGGIVCEDGLYSISRYGIALTTMTMEYNSQIRTNYVSDPIKPVFTDLTNVQFDASMILYADGVLYFCVGRPGDAEDDPTGPIYEKDKILFCYDIGLKAWWTYSLHDFDGLMDDDSRKIIDMFHIDYEGCPEGIGILTPWELFFLPLTRYIQDDKVPILIKTGELSAQKPQQGWVHITQVEFFFDYFEGDITIELLGHDQFGREMHTVKHVQHERRCFDLHEYMRVDAKYADYRIVITGKADFRLTHFIAKVYTQSNRMGLVWGFNDKQSTFSLDGNIHPTYQDYNDIRNAIIP